MLVLHQSKERLSSVIWASPPQNILHTFVGGGGEEFVHAHEKRSESKIPKFNSLLESVGHPESIYFLHTNWVYWSYWWMLTATRELTR